MADVKPIFSVSKSDSRLLLEFEIPGGATTPALCAEALSDLPALSGKLPVFISGRGPVWLFGMLIHAAHATPAVATNDPRLGWVVVESHSPAWAVGQIVE